MSEHAVPADFRYGICKPCQRGDCDNCDTHLNGTEVGAFDAAGMGVDCDCDHDD